MILNPAVKAYCDRVMHWILKFFYIFSPSPYGRVLSCTKKCEKILIFNTLHVLATV